VKNLPVILAALLLLAVGAYIKLTASGDGGGGERAARVTYVIDGDTVVASLASGESVHVRVIGIDTPEIFHDGRPPQCYATRAASITRRLTLGREVALALGREQHDRYGRLLAYVQVRGEPDDIEHTLLAQGAARTLTIAPNTDRAAAYADLERAARQAGRGLWGSCRGR
jgi:endonuclease YncB( thermonuclease family)